MYVISGVPCNTDMAVVLPPAPLQSTVVSALQLEKDEMETKVFVAQGRRRRAESTILESESLVKALQQQTEMDQKSLAEIIQVGEQAHCYFSNRPESSQAVLIRRGP